MPSGEGWWRTAVIYQVYVRSFADGNGDGIGDLAGVRSRLPYLKSLGVDALWFTPWYQSPLADGGYDVQDYRLIDPRFGTLEEAEQLIAEALEYGIRTIVDIVPNHISDRHAWFQQALAAQPGGPERERFWFHPGRGADGEEMPTNWVSSFQGETWTRTRNPDGTAGEWYLHLFTPQQPDLNWNHPDVRREHEDVLRFWFDRGVAGVRIDSAALPVKDPALPDLPAGTAPTSGHPHIDRDELHDIYRDWRAVADEYDGERVLVGEVWLDDAERFARYLRPGEMHTAFNFGFMTQPWSAQAMRDSITRTLAEHAPVGAPATWVLSNHDITRPVTRYGQADSSFAFERKRFGTPTDAVRGARRARAASLLVAALPGSLYIYQGDELGLPEVELPLDAIEDPMHFRSGGVDPGRDGCRVPLPWAGTAPPYGFGGTPWLPQPDDWVTLTVEAQDADPSSTLNLYRAAIALRTQIADFTGSDLEWLELGADVLAFRRGDGTVSITNLGAVPVPLPAHHEVLLASAPLDGALPPDSTAWLALRPSAVSSRATD
ncbi:glycoside hydrolase family 13 protein [Microbacterium sp. ISL-59]|uniref:glycoside hydrolase family 13 protein n=1 Tax=Microbacterium sp. ISL-59 TaxID=2819159 RepID=UPI001BE60AE5|nr:glycoside hydrolase family 13 protein [Microbacterium sp. ISL-59]MBT2495293.1 glycoside hydrolase family 13 protein [Microbacterium sp. ISL-59]